ncbi:MAG: FG-GAP-like repeat-containing protein, partial [Candidatus Poseidoniales archaeon]
LDTVSIAWGDVDGDGDLDLAVGNYQQNNEVYLNSGTALATTPSWTSSNSLYTSSVAWGDVDGDGDLDLAVGNNGNNEVYLNSGSALATTPSWTSSNSLSTQSVAWGDVDGDGDLDLAVGNNVQNNEVYLNQLEGSNYTGNEWYEVGSGIAIDETNDSWSAWINVSSMPTNIDFDITYSVELAYDSVSLAIFNETLEYESWDGTETNHIISRKTLSEDVMSIAGRYNQYCINYNMYHSSTGIGAGGGSTCNGYGPQPSNDGDWIPDSFEGAFTQTSSSLLDTDGDGWGDWIEHWGGSDPSDPSATPTDADNDGLPYLLEVMMGTSDNDNDSDGDGALDFDDFRYGGHPARASYLPPNGDWDSCWDYWEDQVGLNSSNPDSDGDGVYDCFESDPWNASSTPTDIDGDGLPDNLEFIYNTNLNNPDSDGDGVPDSAEIGSGTNPNDVLNYNVNYWSNFDISQSLEQFGTATASTTATTYSANNVLDDDHLSYWQPENPCPGWIEIDLGNVYRPSYIEVSIFNEDYDEDYPRELVIQTREASSDNWRNISSFTFDDNWGISGAFGGYTELHKVRYVRIYCISSNDDLEVPHDIAFSEITIYDSTNLQYVNLSAIDNQTNGETGGTNFENIWATLIVDGENQTANGGYTVNGLQTGVQYVLTWRFTNASSSDCTAGWISTFSSEDIQITDSEAANEAGTVGLNIDYFAVIDWSGIFCLELDLQDDSGTIATSQSWLYIDTPPADGGNGTVPSDGGNSTNTTTDADFDGVNDLFDLCPGTPSGTEVDSDGCETEETHDSVLDVIFDERQEDNLWHQGITVSISDIWLNHNYSMSLKVVDSNGNSIYSYFSPMDEDDQNGWWRFGDDIVEDPTEQNIDLNWIGLLASGEWEGSSRFFEEIEYPFFSAGEYCVEISLGHQIDRNDGPMDVINNIFDKEEICGEFLH